MKSKNIFCYALGTALILSVPLVAMQFSEEVDWKLPDFIVIGTLIFGTGLTFELLSKRVKSNVYKALLAAALLLALLLVWAELAVGIFGTPFAGS